MRYIAYDIKELRDWTTKKSKYSCKENLIYNHEPLKALFSTTCTACKSYLSPSTSGLGLVCPFAFSENEFDNLPSVSTLITELPALSCFSEPWRQLSSKSSSDELRLSVDTNMFLLRVIWANLFRSTLYVEKKSGLE